MKYTYTWNSSTEEKISLRRKLRWKLPQFTGYANKVQRHAFAGVFALLFDKFVIAFKHVEKNIIEKLKSFVAYLLNQTSGGGRRVNMAAVRVIIVQNERYSYKWHISKAWRRQVCTSVWRDNLYFIL